METWYELSIESILYCFVLLFFLFELTIQSILHKLLCTGRLRSSIKYQTFGLTMAMRDLYISFVV